MPDKRSLFEAFSKEQYSKDPIDGCATLIAVEVVLTLLTAAIFALAAHCSSP